MKDTTQGSSFPDKRHAAVCGLFCFACQSFIATRDNPALLEERAKAWNRPVEEIRCLGCRSDTLCFFCREHCVMRKCAEKRGIDFCVECEDYPCADLREFQSRFPHRIELWQDQERIKEVGWEQWYGEKVDHYSCPECGTVNSAYDLSCRKCGATPSCAYVNEHQAEVSDFAQKIREKQE